MKRKLAILSALAIILFLVIPAPAPAETRTIQYNYDDLNRLTTTEQGDNITDYTYDEVGNILNKTVTNTACTDTDTDNYYAEAGCGTEVDCNDGNADIHPGATELCDGVDSDCSDGGTVPVTITLQNYDGTTAIYEASNSITAGTSFTIQAGADVTFCVPNAGGLIDLQPEFTAETDCTFQTSNY